MRRIAPILPLMMAAAAAAQTPGALPVPTMQVIPLPDHQAAITRDGQEIVRYYFHPQQERPFLYPIIGPSGRSLTRMGHPNDPVGHSHHNSVWVSHVSVGGENFWGDRSGARIVHDRILRYIDAADPSVAAIHAANRWLGKAGNPLVIERRGITAIDGDNGQWLLVLDIQLQPAGKEPVVIDKSPFGLVGVRMAKTISVRFGGGLIRNAEGQRNQRPQRIDSEAGLEKAIDTAPHTTFWQRARWCDYSGPIAPGVSEGITLLDHPRNVNHPTAFHTRSDGWMGASLTFDGPITLDPGKPLRLRYGLWVHRGVPTPETIDSEWKKFAATSVDEIPLKK